MGTSTGTAPILGGRKSAGRLFLDLCSEQSGFRVCLEFALMGAVVLGFLHGLQSLWPSAGQPVAGITLPDFKRADDGWTALKDAPPGLKLTLNAETVQGSFQGSSQHRDGSRFHWAYYGAFALTTSNATFSVSQQVHPPAVRPSVVTALEMFNVLKSADHKFSQEYYTLTTRFGDLRAVRFEVASDGVSKTCIGFHKPESGPIYIKGYACSRDPSEVSPLKVACLLEHLRLADVAEHNASLTILYPEVRPCGATPIQSPDGATASANQRTQ
jgi:hypothetical protein